ncbi:hypothetical protein BS78_06G019700 [Paspalum vaginatum]|nr:hypothetical protein BS78_06G019700 [Paspalum vaginatum]
MGMGRTALRWHSRGWGRAAITALIPVQADPGNQNEARPPTPDSPLFRRAPPAAFPPARQRHSLCAPPLQPPPAAFPPALRAPPPQPPPPQPPRAAAAAAASAATASAGRLPTRSPPPQPPRTPRRIHGLRAQPAPSTRLPLRPLPPRLATPQSRPRRSPARLSSARKSVDNIKLKIANSSYILRHKPRMGNGAQLPASLGLGWGHMQCCSDFGDSK